MFPMWTSICHIMRCRFAILAGQHYSDVSQHRYRASQYAPWVNDLKFGDIHFPFHSSHLEQFERLNPGLYVHLLEWVEDKAVILRRASPPVGPQKIIPILLVGDHYVGVTSLDHLLNNNKEHQHNKPHYCPLCLDPSFSTKKLSDHGLFCVQNE